MRFSVAVDGKQAALRVPLAVAVAAFAVFVFAAPPSWYWLDSAELSAAGAAMGSPHPTGFPLYAWLARLASLVPFGEVAFRVALLSAACGAVAVGFTARLVVESARPDAVGAVSAVVAGALLAAGLTFFRNSTVAEVYVPTAAFIAAALWLFRRVAAGGGPGGGLALALVAGLGLGTHTSFRLLLGLPIAAVLIVRLQRGARWPLVAPLLTLLVAVSVHAFLPVRSATGRIGPLDWGHPRTAGAFVDHAVTAARIRNAFEHEIMSERSDKVAHDAAAFAGQIIEQQGPLVLLAALAGLVWLARRRRGGWLAAALLVVAAGDSLYSVLIHPMGIADLQNGAALAVALAALAGVGLAWLGRVGRRAGPYLVGVAGVLLVLPVALFDSEARWAAASGETPRRWTEAVLASVPPRGLAIVNEDSTAAGAFFATTVEAARPDVAVLVRQHLRDTERNRVVLERARFDRSDVDPERVLASLSAARRPVVWELASAPPPPPLRLGDGTPMIRLVTPAASLDPQALRRGLEQLVELFDAPDARDPQAAGRFARSLVGLGRRAIGRGDWQAAGLLFEAALEVRAEHVAALVNLGVVAGHEGDFARAAALTDRALAIEPDNRQALVNGARFALRLNRDERAAALLDRALAVSPELASAWELAGIIDARAGRFGRARVRLERALELDPKNLGARETLDKLPNKTRP